jgi:hypothetical protein
MNEPPKKHHPNKSAGISPALAKELDKSLEQMESGNPDGGLDWDESSETWSNIHPADIGTSSSALHKASSNEQVRFASLVEREKNENPELEHEEAFSRAVEKFNAMQDDEEDADE